jgi:endonuclease G
MRLSCDVLPAGIPQTDTLRFYEGYVASFDGRTRNPKWVLEHITKESLQGEGTRCAVL